MRPPRCAALSPGGICTAGRLLLLARHQGAPDAHVRERHRRSRIGVFDVRPVLPQLLDFVASSDFPAEIVTTVTADWEDVPDAYAARTTKVVLHREPLEL